MMKIAVYILACFIFFNCSAQVAERNLHTGWKFRKAGDVQWMNASVPGTVHTDLMANGKIPDPFLETNEKEVQWVDTCTWEYSLSFTASDKELLATSEFLFEGLDTYADVYLNDKLLLQCDNMFRSWSAPVASVLKKDNTIRIVFHPVRNREKKKASQLPYTLPGDDKVFSRKAGYHYGWDWGPTLTTAGIWKNVKLITPQGPLRISNHQVIQQSLTNEAAKLQVITNLTSTSAEQVVVTIFDETTNKVIGSSTTVVPANAGTTVQTPVTITKPILWWCNGLGKPHLYSLRIETSTGTNNKIIDHLKTGLRTIELVQEKDDNGKSFYFKLNGKPFFVKGANVIPSDNFLPRVKKETYQHLVKEAKDANMNMLRVWGGGVYADNSFYDACDELGILVWQDFMFACAMYPGDDAFLNNVKVEAEQQIIRLRNHPSIALWCGNNEVSEGWHNWGWQKQYKHTKSDSTAIWQSYLKLFEGVLPQQVAALDPSRYYWPSSPQHGWGRKQSMLEGDSHYWGVWWGREPFDVYTKKVGRFMSEYGFQSMPSLYALRSMTREKLTMESPAVRSHQKHATGYETIEHYRQDWYHKPLTFEDNVYISQLLQAEGMKIAVEAHRRAMPRCMGTLYWQLNDCWPVTSWSSIDYTEHRKALHYYVKESFANTLLSVIKNKTSYEVHFINDTASASTATLQLRILDFNGNVQWAKQQVFSYQSNRSQRVLSIDSTSLAQFDVTRCVLIAEVNTPASGRIARQLCYFAQPKDLTLSPPKIKIRKSGKMQFIVSSNTLAKNIFLDAGEDVTFSNNYFDVLPNEKIIVTVQSSQKLRSILKKLTHKTLYSTYEHPEKK